MCTTHACKLYFLVKWTDQHQFYKPLLSFSIFCSLFMEFRFGLSVTPKGKAVTHTYTHTQEILFAGYATGTEHNEDGAAISNLQVFTNRCEPCWQRPPLDSHTWVHIQINTSISNINTTTHRLWHFIFVIGPVSANTERGTRPNTAYHEHTLGYVCIWYMPRVNHMSYEETIMSGWI